MPINLPNGSNVEEIRLPDGSSAERVIGPNGSTVWQRNAIPDSGDLHSHFDFREASGTSSLTDQTGNGHDLSGSYSGPTATINGIQSGEFDGEDDYLDASWSAISQPVTIFIVARLDGFSTGDERRIFDGDGASAGISLMSKSSDDWQIYGGSTVSDGAADGDPHIFSILYDGANSILRIDGTQVASGDVGTFDFEGLTLGAFGNLDRYTDTAVGQMLNYPMDKSGIFSDVESYLSDNWGITI